MALPFFYLTDYAAGTLQITLDEDTSRHIVQVLRMKPGEQINLTDGKGLLLTASIIEDHKKHCVVSIDTSDYTPAAGRKIYLAVSLLKNANRFEWLLEKATELGVSDIIPLISKRTEKEKFRHDRMEQICVSAMLQSQQVWLPILHQPIAYDLLFRQEEIVSLSWKFIAHCEDGKEKNELTSFHPFNASTIILIGPEGDFTPEEIELALHQQFVPVALGDTRLRTETAVVVAATIIKLSSFK